MISPIPTLRCESEYDSWYLTYRLMHQGVSSFTVPVLFPLQIRNEYKYGGTIIGSYGGPRARNNYPSFRFERCWS